MMNVSTSRRSTVMVVWKAKLEVFDIFRVWATEIYQDIYSIFTLTIPGAIES